ncbi:MAG: PKD protein, partial [Candidatus Berkelbacteria bacterium Licking1014_2]
DIAPRNLTASQQSDGRVQIDYQLRYTSTIAIYYYNPATASWTTASSGALSGDTGVGVSGSVNLTSHTAYWQTRTDFSGQYLTATSGFKIKITATASGATGEGISAAFRLDTRVPASLSLQVVATSATAATLTLAASDDSSPLQMMISNNSDFSDGSYETFATTKSWTITADTTAVYARIKDAYGNTSDVSSELLATVTDFELKDASTISAANYRLIILWTNPSGNYQYIIERSTDNNTFSTLSTVSFNGYLDTGLDKDTTYYYRIKTLDSSGDISRPTSVLGAKPGLAPAVSNTPTVEVYGWKQDYGVRAKITWQTDQSANSFIIYATETLSEGTSSTTLSGAAARMTGVLDRTTSHEVMLYNLEPSTTYYFKAISENEIQISGASAVQNFLTPERNILVVSGMKVSGITLSGAAAAWETNKVSITLLEYGPSASYGQTLTDSNWNTNHQFSLSNLSSGTTYHLRVKATDKDENLTTSDDYVFATPPEPVISDVQISDLKSQQATISWTTNVNTDSYVEFGQDDYNISQGKDDATTIHSITIIGLEAKMTYQFRLRVKDSYNNIVRSNGYSLTTSSDVTPPGFSEIKSEILTVGTTDQDSRIQAVISWKTDEPSTTLVSFNEGISGPYSKTSKEDANLNMTHIVTLPDLKPNTSYHFQAISSDQVGNKANSENYTLLTPPKEKSLIQLIIRSLEDSFKWVGKIKDKWLKKQ